MKTKLKSLFRRSTKGGSGTATLIDARRALQAQVDYWETRMFYGDPLFDQWMVDALAASKDGLAALNRLEDLGATTGRADVRSTTPTHYTSIGVKLQPAYDGGYRVTYVLDKRVHISQGGSIQAGNIEQAYATAVAEFDRPQVNAETRFTRL